MMQVTPFREIGTRAAWVSLWGQFLIIEQSQPPRLVFAFNVFGLG